MTASTSQVDVLVVGAGPVGLMAASQLARAGVTVRLVDAAPGPATTSRALGAHARSLEIYDQLGILADVVTQSTRINAFIRHQGVHASRLDFDFGDLKSPFPAMFNVDQVIIERVLRGHAAAAGVVVEWDTTLASFEQDDDGVTAELLHGDVAQHETVRARYLWGCDGGHSTVRKTLGLRLEGAPAHSWLIADAVVHTDIDRDGVHWLSQGGSTLMLFPFPEPGRWRLLDTTGEGEVKDPQRIADQFIRKLSEALGRETFVEEPTWASKFTIQQRAVPRMHVGRCFVSGDAAHVHPPASGQGLNTRVQDAFNLAWKLAMVVHGQAGESLLDTYDAERVPIGQALLASTGEIMGTVMVDSRGDDGRGPEPAKPPQLIPTMSGLSIAYPDSALTVPAEDGAGPRPGQRLLQISADDAQSPGWTALRARLRVPGWHLLEFPGSDGLDSAATATATATLPSWLDVIPISRDRPADGSSTAAWDIDDVIATTLAAAAGDWILVRPDGYLSARGAGAESLEHTVQEVLVR